jgi:hypothetical protein
MKKKTPRQKKKRKVEFCPRLKPFRLPEGERGPVDPVTGDFDMGSSCHGNSACSKRGVSHRMHKVTPQMWVCLNPGCYANC